MVPVVFDLDDLCDDLDPWFVLMDLKDLWPKLKVTMFAIPGRCSPQLLEKYGELDWVELAVHGYHHSARECVCWTEEETASKLKELEGWWPGVRLMKPPGWGGNEQFYWAIDKAGWYAADNEDFKALWVYSNAKRYVYNRKDREALREEHTAIHGHVWDTCDNGPLSWLEMFGGVDEDTEFRFVTEMCQADSYLEVAVRDWGVGEGDLVIDCGAFIGEEIRSALDHGIKIESYEPNADFYKICEDTFGGIKDITIRKAAIGVADGFSTLYQPAYGQRYASSSSMLLQKDIPQGAEVEVETVDIARIVGGRKVKLLKIDVEGYEYDILERILDTCGFDGIEIVAIEDHIRNFENDEPWLERRKAVLHRLTEAGVSLREWP